MNRDDSGNSNEFGIVTVVVATTIHRTPKNKKQITKKKQHALSIATRSCIHVTRYQQLKINSIETIRNQGKPND